MKPGYVAASVCQVLKRGELEMEVLGMGCRGQGMEVLAPVEVCRGCVLDTFGKEFPGNMPSVGRVRRVD